MQSLLERQGIEKDYYPKCRGVWLDMELYNMIIIGRDLSEYFWL